MKGKPNSSFLDQIRPLMFRPLTWVHCSCLFNPRNQPQMDTDFKCPQVNPKSWPPGEHEQLVNSMISFPGGVSLVKGKQGSLMLSTIDSS